MDQHTSHELAYKKGYSEGHEKGYKEGFLRGLEAGKPKWIPVTERLPEDDLPKDSKVKNIKVLGFYKTSMGVPVVRTQTRQKWRWHHRDEWIWGKTDPITHWMPPPEPPKGE